MAQGQHRDKRQKKQYQPRVEIQTAYLMRSPMPSANLKVGRSPLKSRGQDVLVRTGRISFAFPRVNVIIRMIRPWQILKCP